MLNKKSTPREQSRRTGAEDADMHESVLRLLNFARSAESKKQIKTTTELSRELGVSSATLSNWKTRGVSMEGAQLAEQVFGVSPTFVLKGSGTSTSGLHARESAPGYHPSAPALGADAMVLARYFDKITQPERRQVAFARCILAIDAELPEGLGGRSAAPAIEPKTTAPTQAPSPSPQNSAE